MNYESTISSRDSDLTELSEIDSDPAIGRNIMRTLSVLLILALIVTAGYWYFVSRNAAPESTDNEAPTVSVIVPGKQQVIGQINATGTLAARRDIPIAVVGEGGRVTKVYVDAGQWVEKGQIMATIDRSVQNQQAASLGASVSASRADLNLAQANLDRAARLVDRGFISKADIDRLTATRDSAAARVQVALAQLNETRARNNRLDIVAPVSGLVLERTIEPGQTVTQGSGVVFRMAQNGEFELRARLGEGDLAKLTVGTRADVIPAGAAQPVSGQIWQIAPIIDPQTRQGIARIALGYDKSLRPGGFASTTIESGTANVAVLPESAIQNDSKGSYVYIVGSDNKATRRDVKIGSVIQAGLTITEGLSGNEKVIARAAGFVSPGETVIPVVQKPVGGK